MGDMAPGGGGGTPPPGKGGPPDDKGDGGSGEEENEEDDTDEDTVSVTSSSQVSAGRVRAIKMECGKREHKGGCRRVLQRDPNDPSGGGSAGDGCRATTGTQRSEGQNQTTWKGWGNGTYGACWTKGIPRERWIIHHWWPIYFHLTGDTPCVYC